jgi:serine/threonine protein kinase
VSYVNGKHTPQPQNVLLTDSGRIKICDLGQARSFRKAAVTAAVGTVIYMPPEVLGFVVVVLEVLPSIHCN